MYFISRSGKELQIFFKETDKFEAIHHIMIITIAHNSTCSNDLTYYWVLHVYTHRDNIFIATDSNRFQWWLSLECFIFYITILLYMLIGIIKFLSCIIHIVVDNIIYVWTFWFILKYMYSVSSFSTNILQTFTNPLVLHTQ